MLTIEKDYSIKLSSIVVDYIYPDYVFIPIYDNYKLQIKNNELVKKEQILLLNEGGHYLYSPISGKIVGAKDCTLSNGKKQKCLVIENDFKEKMLNRVTMRKNLKQVSKDEFLEILKNKNRLLFDKFCTDGFDKIILSGIVDEPYMASDLFLLTNFSSEILEALSFLAKIYNTNNNLIVLKNSDRDNVEKYTNILGTYPEIGLNIIPDIYPMQKNNMFLKYLGYDYKNTLIVNPKDVLNIYNAIKKNKLMTEKYVTITGNAIENPIVVNAKLGALVKNVIDENIKFLNNNEVDYIVNGLMCGNYIDIKDLIVTNELDGIIINFKNEFTENDCINCGKCYDVCPVNIDPRKTFYTGKTLEDKKVCINCGLCTYICPSFINFKQKIEEIKNEE